jgi:hypothetical protein
MKRDRPVIPDFSKKPKGKGVLSKNPDPNQRVAPPPPATINRSVKPQGTASKSGQRGK